MTVKSCGFFYLILTMAKDINQCKELLQYRATKAGFNGSLSPSDFNTIFNSAEQRYFNFLYKKYGVNQDTDDSIVKFKSDPLTVTLTTGRYTKANDLLHIDSIRTVAGYPLTEVNDDRLGSYLTSEYDAPTVIEPIYVDYNTFIQVYPTTITQVVLVYLKELVPSVWGYTLNGAGRPVYDVATSVQPQWGEQDLDELIYLCGVDLGVNMRDTLLVQTQDKLAKENS